MFTFPALHKTSKRAAALKNFYKAPISLPFSFFLSLFLSFSFPFFSLFLSPFPFPPLRSPFSELAPPAPAPAFPLHERAARYRMLTRLNRVCTDYIYSRRNPRQCCVVTYRPTTSTWSPVLATRRLPSMRSYTESSWRHDVAC